MLVAVLLGASLGLLANLAAGGEPWLAWVMLNLAQPVGQLFLRLLFMLVVPLLFSALVLGLCDLDLGELGRMGARMLGYTVVVSLIAVLIGMTLVNVVGPGRGLPDEVRALARAGAASIGAAPSIASAGGLVPAAAPLPALLVALVPDNPIKAAAGGDMLGVIVFSLLFGLALAVTRTEGALALRRWVQGLHDVSMTLVQGVLRLAPLGTGALLFTMTARLGAEVLRPVLSYVLVVVGGLVLHTVGVYSLSVWLLGGRSPLAFFKGSRLAMVTAFSTASSSATLPTALAVAERELKLPPQVSRFVLTAGSAMNQNGTALFEGVTVLFLAQVYAVPLSLPQQGLVMLICVLAGIGAAGVPAASIPALAMILGIFGIPAEGLGLILGVDRFLDMCRTTVNVTGDLAAAVYVARHTHLHGQDVAPPGTS
jgi:DAACS family dicarboxylate/amino acid:cation (Na+ or H+) symporter